MLTFDRYGLHWVEGDIGLLVQQNRVDHVLGIPMNFDVTVKLPRSGYACPHNLSLQEVAGVKQDIPTDPLIDVMMPIPKPLGTDATFVQDTAENRKVLEQLLKLSSSNISTAFRPLWMGSETSILDALRLTNLSPLILYGYSSNHIWMARKILEASCYLPRRLILLGRPDTIASPRLDRIKTDLTVDQLRGLDLTEIGSGMLTQYMLGKNNEGSVS